MGLGWWRGVLTLMGERVVADLLRDMPPENRVVPGSFYHRPSGRCYAWGLTYYAGEERNESSLPALVDISDTGIRAIEKMEGPITRPGGGGFFKLLHSTGSESTRLDVFVDFPGYEIDGAVLAYKRKDYMPQKSGHIIDTTQKPGGGRTVYFGSRDGGSSFFRFYEKGSQLRENWPILRVEYQAMHERAQQLFSHVCDGEDARAAIAGVLCSQIDFREGLARLRRSGDTHASRNSERYAWWEQLLALLSSADPFDPANSRVVDFERFIEWCKRTWPKSLAKLAYALGDDGMIRFVCSLAQSESAVLSKQDKQLIDRWKESRSPDFV